MWGWAMEFSRTTCFMHANPKPGNGAEERSLLHNAHASVLRENRGWKSRFSATAIWLINPCVICLLQPLFLVINAAFSCNQKAVESREARKMMPMLGNPERAPYAKPAHAMARSIVVNSAFGLLGVKGQDKSLVP